METKYIRIKENTHDKSNYIKIHFHYDLGGYNYFTHKEKPRGYYLTVYPVERSIRFAGYPWRQEERANNAPKTRTRPLCLKRSRAEWTKAARN